MTTRCPACGYENASAISNCEVCDEPLGDLKAAAIATSEAPELEVEAKNNLDEATPKIDAADNDESTDEAWDEDSKEELREKSEDESDSVEDETHSPSAPYYLSANSIEPVEETGELWDNDKSDFLPGTQPGATSQRRRVIAWGLASAVVIGVLAAYFFFYHQPGYSGDTQNSSSSIGSAPRCRVINVSPSDVLNIRAGPGRSESIVGTIPHNGVGILLLSGAMPAPSGGEWVLINYQGQEGWVNNRFLQYE